MLTAKQFLVNILFVVFFLSMSMRVIAGEGSPPMEWGKVPSDQLKLTTYLSDTNSTAIILFDHGEAKFDDEYNIIFKRHRRIKILTKSGFEWGSVIVKFNSDKQSVKDIEGLTIFIDQDGRVITKEMDDESIFEEKASGDWKRMKFTLPALTVGCIVEYRYTIKSTNAHYLPDWYFQTKEPTLWSEYEIKTPGVFLYSSLAQGFQPFCIEKTERVKETFLRPTGMEIVNMTYSRWAMKDVPAIREEPYITTVDDYRSRINFQLGVIHWPGEMPRQILESWEKIVEELSDHPNFGKSLKGNRTVRKQAKAIVDGIVDTVKQIEAVYDFIRNTIVWNEHYRIFTDEDLDDVLESKTGSSAEINLLLTLMLREIGILANPVLLSTRSNGKIQQQYPIASQFDYVICRYVVGNREFLLDATDRLRQFELLPHRALNHVGLLIEGKNYSWINIEPIGKNKSVTLVALSLENDGSFKGKIQESYSEYSGFLQRRALAEKKQDDYVKSLMKSETSGINVDSSSVSNKDNTLEPLVIDAFVSSSTYTQVLNDFIYMNPMTTWQAAENPFKLAKRSFPVDFTYPIATSYILNLSIPDGYILKEYPKDINLVLPSNGGVYNRRTKLSENSLQIVVKHEINQIIFRPEEYTGLRNFYEQIMALRSEQLVFQKTN
jgi:transglutaminase-like putative cysteine protease